jgi:hypothetical protein
MPKEERRARAEGLRFLIERQDIVDWLHQQLAAIVELNL